MLVDDGSVCALPDRHPLSSSAPSVVSDACCLVRHSMETLVLLLFLLVSDGSGDGTRNNNQHQLGRRSGRNGAYKAPVHLRGSTPDSYGLLLYTSQT